MKCALEICLGLQELHSMSLSHLGLSPHNVLMDATNAAAVGSMPPSIQLSDVSMNKILLASYSSIGQVVLYGTFNYMAPEQFEVGGPQNGPQSDMWALACTVIHMVTGKPPMDGYSLIQMVKEVKCTMLGRAYIYIGTMGYKICTLHVSLTLELNAR